MTDVDAKPIADVPVRPAGGRTPPPRTNYTRRAVRQFAAAGVVALVIVAVVGGLVSRGIARDEAIADARLVTAAFGRAVIQPALTDGLVAGDPAALRRMNAAAGGIVNGRTVIRVKLWTPSGRVVYSDEPRLIGKVYPLDSEELDALRQNHADAAVSELSQPENSFERGHGQLLEVYQPVRTPSGQRLLFETYSSYRAVTDREHRIWVEFAPITLGMLVALQLVQIPLARRMARRLDASQQERERLMHDALAASDTARRRIAGDLHDGVVQDLVAASYSLSGSAERANRSGRPDDSHVLRSAADTVHRGIRSLRSLLVEIYPPSLHTSGLSAVLADLASTVSDRGVDVHLSVPDEIDAAPEAEELVFRVAQEALRNVVSHAQATQVDVELRRVGDLLVLTMADDGVGFDPAVPSQTGDRGHFGLRLLRDLATDADASLEVDSAAGRGTRIRLEVPAT
ncbi:MAG TPA: ATP-binding protein [Mycobacteriales bacterium]